HTMTLNWFNISAAQVTLASTPQTFILENGVEVLKDLDEDGMMDIALKYEGVVGIKALIYIKQVTEQSVTTNDEGAVELSPELNSESRGLFIWVIALVTLVIAAIIAYVQYRKRN